MVRSVVVGAVVAALLAVGGLPAVAGNRNAPFLGDLNLDGRADRVVLGAVGTTSTCMAASGAPWRS